MIKIIWSSTCVITESTDAGKFAITDTNIYVSIVTLWTQDNAKLIEQLKTGSERTINWSTHLSKNQ